ncbi:hypothetical protein AQ490_13070 [Wenjunlia vitaminophila]|uniref:Transglutaminase-like domain-containing protein n=1 Tax=Wenjunlia vitaminophila TaxID=76728 RepID=A0A0T6LXN6_WENVI|nr:DUF3488 and transglutaminase-like domain-containing protein [Wenjunlia vitaminophila]KRV50878.1 hypothetical protein AQ490_13070 [Wenjunlia vitaminophila]
MTTPPRTGARTTGLAGGFPDSGYDGPSWAPPRPRAPREERPAPRRVTGQWTLGRTRRLWSLLPVAGLVGTAGFGFHRVFETSALLPVLLVAVPAPMALSLGLTWLLGRRRAAPLWPSLLLTVVAWVAVVCGTLFRDDGGPLPTGDALGRVWSALLDSPHAILSSILPVPDEPELLVLAHAVVWLASFTATELALRTRTALLPAAPAVLAFGFPLVLGVGGPGSNVPLAAGLVAFAAVLVLLRSRAAASGVRGLAVALPLVAVLTVLAGLLGPHAPGLSAREPLDLRDSVSTPVRHPQTTSPLDHIAAWMRNPDTELFTVRSGAEANWRLMVLDQYNGAIWTSDASFAPSGGNVPAVRDADPGDRRALEQEVTVQDLPGIWLPAADRPTSVDLPDSVPVFVDPRSGMLSTGTDGPVGAKVNSGLTYTAESELPVYDVKRLQYAPTADDPGATELVRTDADGQPIPALETFRELAAEATAGSSYPYQQAVKLADWLRENQQFDPRAVSGHSYRALEFFLTESHTGTSEQFAASFAVMARSLGLPTRIAVGFRPGTVVDDASGGTTRQVTGADALAWPEVEFEGIGWVPFYPTPAEASSGGSSAAPAGQPKEREEVDQQITEKPRASQPEGEDQEGTTATGGRADDGGGPPVWVYPPLGVVVLAAAYVLYALWRPRRRRSRRRNAPDSGGQVLGAWEQIVERLTEIGLPPTCAHTATEVAAFGSHQVGGAAGDHLPELARLVNEVGYGGRSPDRATAQAAWRHCDAVERIVVRSVPTRERLRRTLHPRALRRR